MMLEGLEMESFKVTQDVSTDLTIITATGKITTRTLMKWIADYYNGPVTNLHLWDFTVADLSKITVDECRHITLEIKARNHSRLNGKSALVFSSDFMFGLGRIFESYSDVDDVPIYFRCFQNMAEAKNWLGV